MDSKGRLGCIEMLKAKGDIMSYSFCRNKAQEGRRGLPGRGRQQQENGVAGDYCAFVSYSSSHKVPF